MTAPEEGDDRAGGSPGADDDEFDADDELDDGDLEDDDDGDLDDEDEDDLEDEDEDDGEDDEDDEDDLEDEEYESGDVNTVAGTDYEAGDVNTIPASRHPDPERAGPPPASDGGEMPLEVLDYLARSMADDPDAVVIRREERRGSMVLRLHVAPGDMGRVIGRRGRTAQAIRTLVGVAGARDGVQTVVDIVDD
jgi:hypothetical protein